MAGWSTSFVQIGWVVWVYMCNCINMSGKHCLDTDICSLRLLSFFCTLFCDDHWTLGVRYDIIVSSDADHTIGSYSLHDHQFCISHHLLQYKASLMRVERCTNLRVERWELRRQYITMSVFQNSTWFCPVAFDLTCHSGSSQLIAPGMGSILWDRL